MSLTPATQVRSIDPFDSKRFARTHNFKTRLWTMGNNYVFFPDDSFIGSVASVYYANFTPGVAVMSDVMIHITEAKSFNFRDNYGNPTYSNPYVEFLDTDPLTGSRYTSIRQMINSLCNEDDLTEEQSCYMGLKYTYQRNYPPNYATYALSLFPTTFVNSTELVWLSRIDCTYIDSSGSILPVITNIENFYSNKDDVELTRPVFDPKITFDNIGLNCGVVYGVTTDGDHWEADWPTS